MSAGAFVNTFYEASYADSTRHPIKVQPETRDAAIGTVGNIAPDSGAINPISAVTSRGKRARGLVPRKVTIKNEGEPVAGYQTNSVTTIPALSRAFYNAAVKGANVDYLGKDSWVVVGRSPEYVN